MKHIINSLKKSKHKATCQRDNWKKRALTYEAAIRKTLDDNPHLADGDDCTLITLKQALAVNNIVHNEKHSKQFYEGQPVFVRYSDKDVMSSYSGYGNFERYVDTETETEWAWLKKEFGDERHCLVVPAGATEAACFPVSCVTAAINE